MQLSAVERCALRAMVDLALHAGRCPVEPVELAQRQMLAGQDLSRALTALRRAGLARAGDGRSSGYSLARDAASITAGDILRAVEGLQDVTSRGDDPGNDAPYPGRRCPAAWLSARVNRTSEAVLETVTLADLCAQARDPLPGVAGEPQRDEGDGWRLPLALESPAAIRAFHQSILDGVAEPIMVIGMDYHVRLLNRMARGLVAVGGGPIGCLRCYEISHRRLTPCDGVAHPCPLSRVRESGQPATVVHQHFQAGERRYVELIASPLWGPNGTCEGIIECSRDITERTRAEQALQQYAERQRALSERLAEVAEAERERLSRELHDQVGQNLTALGINLNIIQTEVPEDAPAGVRDRLADSLGLVQQTTERIRDVMANLRPPVLDDYGLLAALRWYAEQFARRTGIAVIVESPGQAPRLAGRTETALFRITQEALTNVAKHAGAAHVTVTLTSDEETLRLIVADDGSGFEPGRLAEPGRGRGWGLLSMSERAEAVGGRCRIESFPGLGTRIVVEVSR